MVGAVAVKPPFFEIAFVSFSVSEAVDSKPVQAILQISTLILGSVRPNVGS